MAIKLIEETIFSPNQGDVRKHFVLDSASDASMLPECISGSTAIVADKGGPIFMVNASGEWREL
jgi:hypothetical protein